MELGEPERARSYFEHLEAQGIDLRLAYQPAFLEQLAAVSLWSGSMTPAGSAGPDVQSCLPSSAFSPEHSETHQRQVILWIWLAWSRRLLSWHAWVSPLASLAT